MKTRKSEPKAKVKIKSLKLAKEAVQNLSDETTAKVKAGGLLARIRDLSGAVQEFRSPLDGTIGRIVVKEGEPIAAGRTILSLTPDRATVNDALRGLQYVGTKDDLPLIESFSQGTATNDAELKQQFVVTTMAIEARAKN